MSVYTFEGEKVKAFATRWSKTNSSKMPMISFAIVPENAEYFYSINIYSKKHLKKKTSCTTV